MNKYKRILIAGVAALAITTFAPVVAQAAPAQASYAATDSARVVEKTEWHYRKTSDGKWQKRLWSITYQKWLTDWIDC